MTSPAPSELVAVSRCEKEITGEEQNGPRNAVGLGRPGVGSLEDG